MKKNLQVAVELKRLSKNILIIFHFQFSYTTLKQKVKVKGIQKKKLKKKNVIKSIKLQRFGE